MGRVTVAIWRHRLTRLERETSMDSIDAPSRLPRETSLGILAGIANMTRLNRLTRLTRMTRLPILENR